MIIKYNNLKYNKSYIKKYMIQRKKFVLQYDDLSRRFTKN